MRMGRRGDGERASKEKVGGERFRRATGWERSRCSAAGDAALAGGLVWCFDR